MVTYQDFIEDRNKNGYKVAITNAVNDWKSGTIYKNAVAADLYDKQQNPTLKQINALKTKMSQQTYGGMVTADIKSEISSNFFHRLNTQRNTYLLGNGVTFPVDTVKDKFGANFDTQIKKGGYYALTHAVSFGFWTGKLNIYKATEFCPLQDEETDVIMAGIRFWQIDSTKPTFFTLYEIDGYTNFALYNSEWQEIEPKKPYRYISHFTEAEGEKGTERYDYSALPIIPFWGNNLKQSTLVGLRSLIDAYDVVNSGFADDLNEMQEIFWILQNYGGMTQDDLTKFFRRLKWFKVAEMDTSDNGEIKPFRQEVPYQSRQVFLDSIRKQIYEGFGAFDVHTVSAGATNDHIEAAYQPMDEEADDFEYQVIQFVQSLGTLLGISAEDCTPQFKRNRISNQKEQVEMLIMEEPHLDDYTFLSKLPNISPDEIPEIMKRKSAEDIEKFMGDEQETPEIIGRESAIETAEETVGKMLNGAQTQSLLTVMQSLANGSLTERQAVNIISTAIGVTKEEARAIIRDE